MKTLKILFISDTHLGFDLPATGKQSNPVVTRRHRGPDFFKNYHLALEKAHNGEVDLVLHGGDLFNSSKVSSSLAEEAFRPLREVADSGIPVYIVPGNHEKSQIPYPLLTFHPQIFIFDSPRTFLLETKGLKIALSGIPFTRKISARHYIGRNMAPLFSRLLDQTEYRDYEADIRLLCLHQSFEGATVGIGNYVFRFGEEVVKGKYLPRDRPFAAALVGHIHRVQVLNQSLSGEPFPCPVVYPGAIERTSFVEREEKKGYLLVHISDEKPGGKLIRLKFKELPCSPMVNIRLDVAGLEPDEVVTWIKNSIEGLEPDSLVNFKIIGEMTPQVRQVLELPHILSLTPPDMILKITFPDSRR